MRTIGEVAAAFGIRQHVLRYWEQHFPMLRPLQRSGGRRLYRPEDVELVATINQLLNQQGYTIKGARAVLEGKAVAAGPAETAGVTGAEECQGEGQKSVPADVRAQLTAIRNRLAAALQVR